MGAMVALHPLVATQDSVWLGNYAGGPVEWYWLLADHHFYKEGERNYRKFKSAPSSHHNIVTSKDGMWSSAGDFLKLSFPMCYDGKEYAATGIHK